jgi:hypothetical protein
VTRRARALLAGIGLALATGCTAGASPEGEPGASAPAFTACRAPRPEICTREYRPVCARLAGEPERWVTRSNGCVACSDPAVEGHRPGACGTDASEAAPRQRLDY